MRCYKLTPFLISTISHIHSTKNKNMAVENGEKTEDGVVTKPKGSLLVVLILLRVFAFMATAAATLVMALDKQTKTFVVATIGTTPIKATLTAKFQHTPAFVFFVIVNAMASFHNLLMLVVELFGHKYDLKGHRFSIVPILDIMTLGLVSGGATAAAFMGELGRNGNSHARWNKICDKFQTFCDRGSAAMLISFISLLFFIIILALSIFRLQRIRNPVNYSTI